MSQPESPRGVIRLMVPRRCEASWRRIEATLAPQLIEVGIEASRANLLAAVIEIVDGRLHPDRAVPCMDPTSPVYEAPSGEVSPLAKALAGAPADPMKETGEVSPLAKALAGAPADPMKETGEVSPLAKVLAGAPADPMEEIGEVSPLAKVLAGAPADPMEEIGEVSPLAKVLAGAPADPMEEIGEDGAPEPEDD